MKTVLRVAFIMAFVLSIGAAAFAQHCKQTNLVSNTSGVSPAALIRMKLLRQRFTLLRCVIRGPADCSGI
jgi:hypothetical protein